LRITLGSFCEKNLILSLLSKYEKIGVCRRSFYDFRYTKIIVWTSLFFREWFAEFKSSLRLNYKFFIICVCMFYALEYCRSLAFNIIKHLKDLLNYYLRISTSWKWRWRGNHPSVSGMTKNYFLVFSCRHFMGVSKGVWWGPPSKNFLYWKFFSEK